MSYLEFLGDETSLVLVDVMVKDSKRDWLLQVGSYKIISQWSLSQSCFVFITIIVPVQPVFPDVTVSEGDLLTLECTMDNNIPNITTFEILDQNGMAVSAPRGVYSVPSVTREYAGTYSCIVMSTIDNSTVNDTSEVTIQCKLSLTSTILCYLHVVKSAILEKKMGKNAKCKNSQLDRDLDSIWHDCYPIKFCTIES